MIDWPKLFHSSIEVSLFRRLILLLVISLTTGQVYAQDFDEFKNKLDLAEDYLIVSPSRSIAILKGLNDIDKAPSDLFIRWHLLNAKTAVSTSHYNDLHSSLEAIFKHQNTPYFKQQLTSILSATGIWLRHEGYLDDALISLKCGYKNTIDERKRLLLINSMALVVWGKNDNEKARNLYLDSFKIAQKLHLDNVTALIESNLGYIALEQGHIADAENYFRNALIHFQNIDKRAGKVSAGLNLMMVFLIQKNEINFERLHGPTAILTHAFPDEAKQALLLWLEAAFKKQKGEFISRSEKKKLQIAYSQLGSNMMKIMVLRYLAKSLEIPLKRPTPIIAKRFSSPWFGSVKACNW